MNHKKIIGEKVILRPIALEDTGLIVKWRNNPLVSKNFIFRKPFTWEMHEKWMKSKVANGEVVQYIIVEKDSGLPVGSVYFRDIEESDRSAEFGIFIGENSARGKGIGTEAETLFLRYGIEELHLEHIKLRVLEGNEPAYRSYCRAGFVVDETTSETIYLDGVYRKVIFMTMRIGDVI